MKKFWKRTEGFTLVELVVVIAILGVLAGVGTVGYSGYVKKANMAADQQLASEVANALQLYYYSNPTQNTNGTVVLAPDTDDNSAEGSGDAAMVAVFGDGWENNLSLKYDGWKSATLTGSSFDGNEEDLLDTVGELTVTFTNFIKDYEGSADGFFPYLQELGINKDTDPEAAANAAVLYVGETVANVNQEKVSEILTGVPAKIVAQYNESDGWNSNQIIMETVGVLQTELGGSTLATAALLYAYAESYSQAVGKELTIKPENITNGSTGLAEVQRAFTELMDMNKMDMNQINATFQWGGITADPETGDYVLGENAAYQKDAQAVLSAMDAVNNASDLIKDKVYQENLFEEESIREMVMSYLKGEDGTIMVVIQDGRVITNPPNLKG